MTFPASAYSFLHKGGASMTNSAEEQPREFVGRWPGSCFACSNPSGLQLRFWHTPEGVETRCSVPATYCGFDGLVHGGIISTILDEASCWVLFAKLGKLGVTQKMTTSFVKPVRTETGLVVTARIVTHDSRGAVVSASISDSEGVQLASSESSWSFPRLSRIAAFAGVDEGILETFLDGCCSKAAPQKESHV